jgi:hypothetical protein
LAGARGWAMGVSCAAALMGFTGTSDAALVQGKVIGYLELRNPVWLAAKNPTEHGYSFREPVTTVRSEFRALFPYIPRELCIVALGAAPLPPPQEAVQVRVGGGRTAPVTLVARPGTKLVFLNADPFSHALYGVGLPSFPASETKGGDTRAWSVPGPGIFEIRDELAPSVRMWVVGEPRTMGIVYPSTKGEFLMSLEPGDYTIQPYFAGKPVGEAMAVGVTTRDIDLKAKPIKVAEKAPAKKDDND